MSCASCEMLTSIAYPSDHLWVMTHDGAARALPGMGVLAIYEHAGLRLPPLDLQEGNEGRFAMHLAWRGLEIRIWGAQDVPTLAFEEVRPIPFSWAVRLSEEGSQCAATKCHMSTWSVDLPENWVHVAERLSLVARFNRTSAPTHSTTRFYKH